MPPRACHSVPLFPAAVCGGQERLSASVRWGRAFCGVAQAAPLRRFRKKKIPDYAGATGRIIMSHFGKRGSRSKRASTARIAALLRAGESLPPRRERIDDEITGLEGTAKGHRQLPGVFVNKATRDIFLLAPEVMVTGFVIPAGVPPTRECTNIHRSFTVYAHAFDLFRCLACPVFFFLLSKMASVALIL